MNLVAGLDDAGRGAIIGPLVIAGILVREDEIKMLRDVGVKDSKLLSALRREVLFEEISRISRKIEYEMLSTRLVDTYVKRRKKYTKLNLLEAEAMASIINRLKPNIAYVDASDVSTERFKKQIEDNLVKNVRIVSTHKADRIYVVVSAASIIAKVIRDREVSKIKKILGDFGSGYPSDQRTIRVIRDWVKNYGEIPPYTRLSWRTWKKISQMKLDEI